MGEEKGREGGKGEGLMGALGRGEGEEGEGWRKGGGKTEKEAGWCWWDK